MADNLLNEVDQALRADRAHALWQKHRKTLMLVVAFLILGTAANSAWTYMRELRGGKALEALSENQTLLEKGNAAEAAAGFKAIADNNSGELKDLALIWQARALVADGKKPEAAAVLGEAVGSDSLWADVACLRLAGLDSAKADCLAAKKQSPLASTRAEWAAAVAWSKGDAKGAIASLEALIANKDTSEDAALRLSQWLASMKAQTKDAQ